MVELSSSLSVAKVTEAMLPQRSRLHRAVAKDLEPGALVAAYPSAQGRGATPLLLEIARAEAWKRGKRYVQFDCAAERLGIRRFCERRGFACVGERTVGRFFAVLSPWRLA